MDCSTYTACVVPSEGGITCTYNGSLWTTNYYASGFPDDSSYSGAWTYQGTCDSSTSDTSSVDFTGVQESIETLNYTLLTVLILGCFFIGLRFFK